MFKLKKAPSDIVLDPALWVLHEAEFSKLQ